MIGDFSMIGDYAAAWMPSVFIPLLVISAFAAMGILFTVVESTD
ncbi:MAG: photosystem I reaction center subunit VIII [Candidatus Synechococcus spongiarum SP3]|uniref:Photosystem I reaction center subunit VIII n=1 Tax=Candidatus Synechococcus spongiarum SP3 TaxID=1604020 RepID=A0A0G2HJV8_9SYNE|nr:MAG: photosystem I reaction center subunit VIII [Candidatus Synechococcus spongiarum SP3]